LIRQKKTFRFPDSELDNLKKRMLHWANQYGILLFLDSNRYTHTDGRYECLCAADAVEWLPLQDADDPLTSLQTWHETQQDWLFGHICYDFKNQLETLTSRHKASSGFATIQYFRPRIVCSIARGVSALDIETIGLDPEAVWDAIQHFPVAAGNIPAGLKFHKHMDKDAYLAALAALREHIINGDCYEINFCNQAYSTGVTLDPLPVFERLNELSPAPFAAYYKNGGSCMMCASPERYLMRGGNQIIAQPIKGTAARGADPERDRHNKEQLRQSIKEQAENVMIVDLMRNDLARCCVTGSVEVTELFGIYSFPQVHQMISTISGTLKPGTHFSDIIRCSFPMGSMTGAPKIKVMQLIDRYEQARRELFSGTVGYIDPQGNFDSNVVIRSIFYNRDTGYLSYQTGGAITYESVAEQEWEETLLKAAALERAVQG
jgi:para-aminobenzoate synthetase component 1